MAAAPLTAPSTPTPDAAASHDPLDAAAARAADAAHDAISAADRQADATLDRLVRGAHRTIDRLAEKAAPLADRLGQRADRASQTLRARAGDLDDLREEWTEGLRSTVREHPLTAVATAAAVGVVIARLVRR